MDERQFKELSSKLDFILRALTLNLVKDLSTQQEKILALSSFGIAPKDIASILGTSSNTVSVALSVARKKTKSNQDSESNKPETDRQAASERKSV